ncbi:hypothetical protein JHK82_018915 [Glycine max]|nr:hypothetical protein JHK85_019355 [Glycine max]KAG5038093.1 hypothetical protein JHK86_018933 [Glycine max]KAG5143220.1 hypothetical protein JHK82_018915 [Glycine max]
MRVASVVLFEVGFNRENVLAMQLGTVMPTNEGGMTEEVPGIEEVIEPSLQHHHNHIGLKLSFND